MSDWTRQITLDDVAAGEEIPEISMPITLQRLVMEAGSNRDFSLIHHMTRRWRRQPAPPTLT